MHITKTPFFKLQKGITNIKATHSIQPKACVAYVGQRGTTYALVLAKSMLPHKIRVSIKAHQGTNKPNLKSCKAHHAKVTGRVPSLNPEP